MNEPQDTKSQRLFSFAAAMAAGGGCVIGILAIGAYLIVNNWPWSGWGFAIIGLCCLNFESE